MAGSQGENQIPHLSVWAVIKLYREAIFSDQQKEIKWNSDVSFNRQMTQKDK